MPGHKKMKQKIKQKALPKAMSTAEFDKKMAAIKADRTLTATQKQAKMKQMQQTRVARKKAMVNPKMKRR
jgi:hypothetical protein